MVEELQSELIAHEVFRVRAGTSGLVIITDLRVALVEWSKVVMALPFKSIRRMEFNVEAGEGATLTIVPVSLRHRPQILRIREADYTDAAAAVASVGRHLNPAHREEVVKEVGRDHDRSPTFH